MGEAIWQRTADAVRAAFDGGDLTDLGPLLAPDLRWHGAGPGGCHSAAEALEEIRGASASGARFRLVALHRTADRLLLRVAVEPGDRELHQMLTLDADGHITRLLDYGDGAVAEADLTVPAPGAPAGPVRRLVPFVGVRDVPASIAFYRLLGFDVTREHHAEERVVWAALRSGDAELMLAEAEPVEPGRHGVLFYLYCDDLAGLREHLRANGAAPSEIADGSPGPREEMRVDDPDGYCLMIAQTEA